MYTSIFDIKNKITVVKTSGTYPHKDNCVHVNITGPNNFCTDIHYLLKSEYELALHIRTFAKILRKNEYDKLIDLIDKFGDQKYFEGSDSAEMAHSEDI